MLGKKKTTVFTSILQSPIPTCVKIQEKMLQVNRVLQWEVTHSTVKLVPTLVNPFPQNKILDQTKLRAFADDKLNVMKLILSVFDRVENIVAKGEIACTSNFSLSHNVFKRLLSQRRQKVSLCGNGLINLF